MNQQLTVRRTIAVAAACVAVLALATACGSGGTPGKNTLSAAPIIVYSDQASPAVNANTLPSSGPQSAPPHVPTTPPPVVPTQPATNAHPAAEWPAHPDCISYDPGNLSVSGDVSSATYLVTDGSTVVIRVHGQDDQVGQQALALAQRYRRHCFIGRNNNRGQDAGDYTFDYWRDPSGQTPAILDQEDLCSSYNNRNLTVEDMGDGDGWRVKDHDDVLQEFDNESEARDGYIVLRKYSQACSIGYKDDTDDELGTVSYWQ